MDMREPMQTPPPRTLEQVKTCLDRCKKKNDGCDVTMARMMLNHGRLTAEAREWVAREYPQGE
jgi:hypothetical protein